MNYKKMLALWLRPHPCTANNCRQVIDGVLVFCIHHWRLLNHDERDNYLSMLARLSINHSAEMRWRFYQLVGLYIERIENREAIPPDGPLYGEDP